jgi:hypothetical protein
MGRALSACLLTVGVIHLLPLVGVVGASRLSALYGIAVAEPNLELLLRHRPVLFGAPGGLCVAAAFRPALQGATLAVAAASVVSFLLLARTAGGYNAQVGRVVIADRVALAALALGAVAYWRTRGTVRPARSGAVCAPPNVTSRLTKRPTRRTLSKALRGLLCS